MNDQPHFLKMYENILILIYSLQFDEARYQITLFWCLWPQWRKHGDNDLIWGNLAISSQPELIFFVYGGSDNRQDVWPTDRKKLCLRTFQFGNFLDRSDPGSSRTGPIRQLPWSDRSEKQSFSIGWSTILPVIWPTIDKKVSNLADMKLHYHLKFGHYWSRHNIMPQYVSCVI